MDAVARDRPDAGQHSAEDRGILLAQADSIVADGPGDGGLRFEIRSYQVEGNTLLPQPDIVRLLAPYTGKLKDFGDVQRALEALQDRYQAAGYAGIQVLLPGDPGMNLRQLPFTLLLTNPASRRGLFFRRGFCGAQGLFTYNHRVNKTC